MLTAIIVGVGQWERYTKPLLDSIARFMPDMRTVLVDNGNRYPDVRGVYRVALDEVVCYAEAINEGMQAVMVSDWYLILNNDILIEKPFGTEDFDPGCLYGFIKYRFREWEYLAGWGLFSVVLLLSFHPPPH